MLESTRTRRCFGSPVTYPRTFFEVKIVCGRYSSDLKWEDFAKLYDLSKQGPMPAWNFEPSYNVCPTDQVPVVTSGAGGRQLVLMRWGLVPNWWSKPLKELRMATFNARAESVAEKP